MKILFVISASLWTWILARCIAFGPRKNAICWQPNMKADTWYRLTTLPTKLPHQFFNYMPLFIAVSTITPLYIQNEAIHTATVLILLSEHTYIPIFVAHVHTKQTLVIWATINIGMNILIIWAMGSLILAITIIAKIGLHTWFATIEIYMIYNNTHIQRDTPEYEERKNRVITV
tara:strand:+ start:290 stop:811 length:522 start_codon:yes stop_codon:yes gene_type:complete